jgi:hypothetical protein
MPLPSRSGRLAALAVLPVAFTLAGCDPPTSVGENTSIVVAAPAAVWDGIESAVADALEPSTFTVRDERIFDVAHVDPTTDDWTDFRKVRRLLVVGEAADPWVARALEEVEGEVSREPAILEAEDVWARPQHVTIILVPPGSSPEVAAGMMGEVGERYVRQLEDYSRSRMFVTGEHEGLADSLARVAGFSMRLPNVYRVEEPRPGIFVFRNDQPDPSQLIRQITVTRRPSGDVPLTPEAARAWRAEVASQTTDPPQLTDTIQIARSDLTVDGRPAVEMQATWMNPPDGWPAGGPIITRLVQCPEHTYLVDGWLYAPGRAKYEYMVQIQTLLDSFRCAGSN